LRVLCCKPLQTSTSRCLICRCCWLASHPYAAVCVTSYILWLMRFWSWLLGGQHCKQNEVRSFVLQQLDFVLLCVNAVSCCVAPLSPLTYLMELTSAEIVGHCSNTQRLTMSAFIQRTDSILILFLEILLHVIISNFSNFLRDCRNTDNLRWGKYTSF